MPDTLVDSQLLIRFIATESRSTPRACHHKLKCAGVLEPRFANVTAASPKFKRQDLTEAYRKLL